MSEASGDENAQEDLASARLAQTVLTPAAEHEWDLLRELVAFADKLVVAFIFADRFPVRVLRARLEQQTVEEAQPFRLIVCDDARQLREEALAKVLSPRAEHDVTWFEAFGTEAELRAAWFFAAQRWNEHREPLRRSSLRALIVAAPTWAKPVIRLAAPDLWSITNLVIEPAALAVLDLALDLPKIKTRPKATAAELALLERRVEWALELPSGERRFWALTELALAAVLAGDLNTAARAAADLAVTPERLEELEVAAREGKSLVAFARLLSGLGTALGEIERNHEALLALRKAVEILREASPGPSLDLAFGLKGLGKRLFVLGLKEDCLNVTLEAVQLLRRLAESRTESAWADLAASLINLSEILAEVGRFEEALAAALEGAATYRDLAITNPTQFRTKLASSLLVQGIRLENVGSLDEARVVLEEAANRARELKIADPGKGLMLTASTLLSLCQVLLRSGKLDEALSSATEMVALTIELTKQTPDRFSLSLKPAAEVLINLIELTHSDDPAAITVLQEAQFLLDQIADNPGA